MKEDITLQDYSQEETVGMVSGQRTKIGKASSTWLNKILTLSVVSNILLAVLALRYMNLYHSQMSDRELPRATTPYAQLERNKVIPIGQDTPYSGHNITETRQMWEDISIDAGMVALPDSFVEEHMLPAAQRYPWDHGKGLYFINGFHNMHCLRAVHISLMEFAHGERQSRRFQHVLHCMEALRQDIICNADDTPRYTTADLVPESGMGQPRMCRDWDQLEKWAGEYNACYHFINQTATGFPNVLRYTWCPDDSADLPEVRRIMGGNNLTDLL